MRSLLPEINFDAKDDSSNALEPLQSFGSKSTNIESLWKEKKPSSISSRTFQAVRAWIAVRT